MMPTDPREQTTDRPHSRVPVRIMLTALLPALLATVLFVFLFMRTSSKKQVVESHGMMRVTLSQKDASFRPIPRAAGGATGVVWYTPSGPAMRFQLRAYGLKPGGRYVLEMQVDKAIYTVAGYAPDARGDLAIDTALTQFQEGVCVGTNYDPPTSVTGHHLVKFWIKHDGSPAAGTMPGIADTVPGAALRCHGDGDGDYAYVLLENDIADFTGR
jgi:hypothetical protein